MVRPQVLYQERLIMPVINHRCRNIESVMAGDEGYSVLLLIKKDG